jgi:hypothetical protein
MFMPFLDQVQNAAGRAMEAAAQGTQQAIDQMNSTLALLQEVGYEISDLKIEMATVVKVTVQLKFNRPVTDEQLAKKHPGIATARVSTALQRVNQWEVVMGTPPHVVATWKAPAPSAAAPGKGKSARPPLIRSAGPYPSRSPIESRALRS